MTSAIERLQIGVPSNSEQDAISQILKLTEAKESIHQRTADRLREFFRALLHQLMTAQIRAHDLELSELEIPGREAELQEAV
jgi:type I restriction enzyme S subunit